MPLIRRGTKTAILVLSVSWIVLEECFGGKPLPGTWVARVHRSWTCGELSTAGVYFCKTPWTEHAVPIDLVSLECITNDVDLSIPVAKILEGFSLSHVH